MPSQVGNYHLHITYCIFAGETYGRTINLNVSYRAKQSLKAVGMEEKILRNSVKMTAKMIHPTGKQPISIPFSSNGEVRNAVDRTTLHDEILSEVERYPNVTIYFQHKLTNIDFNTMTLTFLNSSGPTPKEVMVRHDFIFGCDGAYSTVREHMKRHGRLNVYQGYAYHGYKELLVPPTAEGEHALESDHLHLWGENECMAAGIPTLQKKMRISLFFPMETFSKLTTKEDVLTFFRKRFPHIVALLGEKKLVNDFLQNPANDVYTVKCTPHHTPAGALLLGDSAHAMVPFLTQALNCGFEDCLVFSEILKCKKYDLFEAAEEYSRTRCADTNAICDLSNDLHAQAGFSTTWISKMKMGIKSYLSILMPRTFMPLYAMVTFTRIPYATAVQWSHWQDRVVSRGLKLAGLSTFVVAVLLVYRYLPLTTWMKLNNYSVRLQISRA